MEEIAVSERQRARIALLEHYTSQTQNFRVSILTGFIVILTALQSWLSITKEARPLFLNPSMSILLSAAIVFIIHFVVRLFWYSQLSFRAIVAEVGTESDEDPDFLLGRLNEVFSREARNHMFATIGRPQISLMRSIVLIIIGILLAVVISWAATACGLGPNILEVALMIARDP